MCRQPDDLKEYWEREAEELQLADFIQCSVCNYDCDDCPLIKE